MPPAYDPDGTSWFAGPPETAVPEAQDTELGPDEPGPIAGPAVALAHDPEANVPDGDVELADPSLDLDPCSWVPVAQWQSWVGSAEGSAEVASPGVECSYLEPSDSVRMSVAYFRAGQGSRYLGDDDKSAASAETEIGFPAYWTTAHPLPFASTMVVECPQGDLVIMIFARGSAHPTDDIHRTAQGWAQLASSAVTG